LKPHESPLQACRQSLLQGYLLHKQPKIESASQAPVDYFFTDELFDKYRPPADMVIDEDAFAELRSELLGQVTKHRDVEAL